MSIFKKRDDLPLKEMVRIENDIDSMNETYEMCTGEKITDFSEFDYEKYLNFYGFKIEIDDLSRYFDGEVNYMTMKDTYGNPIIKIDFILASKLKEDKTIWNDFLIRRFAEVSINYGEDFNKYPKGSIFIKGKINVQKQKELCKK